MKNRFYILFVILLGLIFISVAPINAQETKRTILVTTAADSGQGSFRWALENVRPGERIIFDPAVFPPDNPTRILLRSQLPPLVRGEVIIDGTDAGVILDGSLLGAPTQSGFIDDIQLLTETGENLITNGDFQSDLNYWMLWRTGEDEKYSGIARWTDAEGAENPGAVEIAPHSRGGDITLTYHDQNEALDMSGAENHPSGIMVPIPVDHAERLTLVFQYKRVNLSVNVELIDEDNSGSYDPFWQDYYFSDDWRQGRFEIDVPDGATELFLNFNIFPSEYLSGLVVQTNDNVIQGLQIINFPGDGIALEFASGNQIGGARTSMTAPCISPCNLLSGNIGSGISIQGGGENIIQGNFMGVDISGTQAQPNAVNGVRLFNTEYNLIGGEGGEGNIISTNSIDVEVNEGTAYNEIRGNYIGVDISGEKPLDNPHQALSFALGSHDNIVENNIISASEVGILIDHESYNNQIRNNFIGTDLSHTLNLGNQTGVYISNDSYKNTIGPGNYILFNDEEGVYIAGSETLGNRITQNVIEQNGVKDVGGGRQIVVSSSGDWLSPPTITKATTREISGIAQPNSEVEIYIGDDRFGGEYVKTVPTEADGTFRAVFVQNELKDKYITLLAFDSDGTTSEFSASIQPEELPFSSIPGLILPSQISTDIKVITVNILLAVMAFLFIGANSTYFNETLENYQDEINEFFLDPVKRFLRRIFPKSNKREAKYTFIRIMVSWGLILLFISFIQSLLDPDSLFTIDQLKLIGTLFLGGFVVGGLQTLGEVAARKIYDDPPEFQQAVIGWPSILLAGISAAFSSWLHLSPGLVLGSVDTFILKPDIEDEATDAFRALIVKVIVLTVAAISWVFSLVAGSFIPFFEIVFIVGFQYVFFELIPLDALDGSVLKRQQPKIWWILFIFSIFGMFHVFINPDFSDVMDIVQGDVFSLFVVLVLSSLFSVLLRWIIVFYRKEKFILEKSAKVTIALFFFLVFLGTAVQLGALEKVGSVDIQEKLFIEPTPIPTEEIAATEEQAPYTTHSALEFDTIEDIEYLDLFIEADDPSQVPLETFLHEGALRIGDGNLLREGTLPTPLHTGSFAHLRMRLSAEACYHVDLGFNNDQHDEYWQALRIDGCASNSHIVYVLQENEQEQSIGYLSSGGSAVAAANEWADIIFWLPEDSSEVYALTVVDGKTSHTALHIPEEWQSGKAFLGFGGWLDPEYQFMDVDFIKVGEGLLDKYLAENLPAYDINQIEIDAFLQSAPQAFPELTTPDWQDDSDSTHDLEEPDSVVAEWLSDAEIIFAEDASAMAENEGGQFGAGAIKTYNPEENVFTFSDDRGAIWMPLNTYLDQFDGMTIGGNQAMLIKFQPLPPYSLSFNFVSENPFGIDFSAGGTPQVFWAAEMKGEFRAGRMWSQDGMERFSGSLRLEEGGWYYALMAIDNEGNFRSVIWEVGNPDSNTSFSGAFAERVQGDSYKNASWQFLVGSPAPMTLNVAEYQVIKFSGFAQ